MFGMTMTLLITSDQLTEKSERKKMAMKEQIPFETY